MANLQWADGTIETVASTSLNSLADDGNAISSEIDNSGGSWIFDDVELNTAVLGFTPASGAHIELYLCPALDGTNFVDGADGMIDPASSDLVGVFEMRDSTAAQTHIIRGITLPKSKLIYTVINKSGGTLASSGNTLKRKPYSYVR